MSIKSALRADRTGNVVIAKTLKDGNLALGANEAAVKWTERMLKLAGFNPGTYDRKFDAKTASALKQFQAARGLPATGELDAKTFEHLKGVQKRVRRSAKSPVFGAGQKDRMIRKAEVRLRRLGYDVGKADGVFDKKTASAVAAYKKDQGKKEFKSASGLLGEAGRRSLARESSELNHAPERRRITGSKAKRAYRKIDALTAKAAAKKTTVPALNADGTPKLDGSGKPVTTTKIGLGIGDKGRAVRNLQARLEKAGYDVGQVDGVFDTRTAAALKAFQSRSKLAPTGRVGPQTWKKLAGAVMLAKDGFSPSQRMGERSSAVKRSEALLQKLGYLKKREVDGLFDKDTQAASRRFERKYKLGDDGAIGEGQYNKMKRVLKARNAIKTKKEVGYINGSPRKITLGYVGSGEWMRLDVAKNFLAMKKAAAKRGISLSATSGFRSMAEQRYLYNLYLSGRGNLAARPGYSNHQGGLSMDIGGVNGYGTKAFNWLKANAGRYGFRNDVGGEFWHWTYYGR